MKAEPKPNEVVIKYKDYPEFLQQGTLYFNKSPNRVDHLYFDNVMRKVTLKDFVNELPLKSLALKLREHSAYKADLEVFSKSQNCTLETLVIQNFRVVNAHSISNIVNLTSLTLVASRIQDFSFLKDMNLTELTIQLARFSMEEKRAVSQMQKLQRLSLNKCEFREVHLLQSLTQLRDLSLVGNSLKNQDFMDVRFRLLQTLDVSCNKLTSLDHIPDLSDQLCKVNADSNRIGKLFYAGGQQYSLEELDLSRNRLFDLSGLARLPFLKNLNVQRNALGEKRMQPIKQLELKTVNITCTQCTTVDFINPKKIQHLIYENSFYCNNISSMFEWDNLNIFKSNYIHGYLKFKYLKNIQFSTHDSQLFKNIQLLMLYGELQRKIKYHLYMQTPLPLYVHSRMNLVISMMKLQNGFEQRNNSNVLKYRQMVLILQQNSLKNRIYKINNKMQQCINKWDLGYE
ncbi:LPXTG_cell wall anchor domain-containing protein [Hexamita inflata]|uniref:LPXTG cell wall anchor domain-containing protein n=1 Tax=Hexamita inflata TaxID=28002 RepID=A0AA86NCW1_9EUKA|nr:LPXTG cell wall anchor domain-containing protein [Hexamita inflata]